MICQGRHQFIITQPRLVGDHNPIQSGQILASGRVELVRDENSNAVFGDAEGLFWGGKGGLLSASVDLDQLD